MIGSNSGQIVRRSTGEPAIFRGPGAQLLVRVYHQGGIRRFAAGRIAWCDACGEWPKGVVKPRNGVDDDLRPENLILVKAGRVRSIRARAAWRSRWTAGPRQARHC